MAIQALPHAFKFGFLKTALIQQFFLLACRQVTGNTALITFLFVASHQGLKILDFIGNFLPHGCLALLQSQQFMRLLQALHLAVDGSNLRLTPLELALRVQQIINRRHKKVVEHASSQVARERCQKAQLTLMIFCHEHAQHLSGAHFIGPIGP